MLIQMLKLRVAPQAEGGQSDAPSGTVVQGRLLVERVARIEMLDVQLIKVGQCIQPRGAQAL